MERLNKEEHRLEAEAHGLRSKYRNTTDSAARKELRGEVSQLVTKQFEVRQQRRQIELQHLEEQLGRLKAAIEKRTSNRQALIDQRTDQLLGEVQDAGF